MIRELICEIQDRCCCCIVMHCCFNPVMYYCNCNYECTCHEGDGMLRLWRIINCHQ